MAPTDEPSAAVTPVGGALPLPVTINAVVNQFPELIPQRVPTPASDSMMDFIKTACDQLAHTKNSIKVLAATLALPESTLAGTGR